MCRKAGRVHGITTVAQLPLGAAEQSPCVLPSPCSTNSQGSALLTALPRPYLMRFLCGRVVVLITLQWTLAER